MNSDITPDELAARIASISVRPPEHNVDIEQAVRTGRRQLWHQRLAVAGAFGCVAVAAVASAVLLSPAHHHKTSATTPTFGARHSASPTEQIGGRWLATSVDGRDVSSWRDLSGLPATVIIGADGTPGQWQVNRACGPLIDGDFVRHQDGSVTQTSPPTLRMQSCPDLRTLGPDLVGVLERTAFIAVDQPGDSASRAMSFLDHNRKVIARWREDTSIKSPASICEKALGAGATSDGTFTTVQWIRDNRMSAVTNVPEEVFPNVPGEEIVVYCKTAGAAASLRYAVAVHGQKVELR